MSDSTQKSMGFVKRRWLWSDLQGRLVRRFTPVVLALLVVVLLASPAEASSGFRVSLGITSPTQIVVDDADQTVFISDNTTKVVAVSFNGAVEKTFSLSGVSSMALDPSTDTLYVGDHTGPRIHAIDAASLQAEADITLTGVSCVHHLALAGSTLWFTYDNCTDNWGLAGYNLNTQTTGPGTPYRAVIGDAQIAADPADPGVIFTADSDSAPPYMTRWDVSDGVAGRVTKVWQQGSGAAASLVVSPDGSQIYMASGAPSYGQSFDTTTLAPTGDEYQTGLYPTAVALSADGQHVFVSRNAAGGGSDVFEFNQGSGTPTASWTTIADANTQLLGVAADGSRLFAVARLSPSPAVLSIVPIDGTVPTTTHMTLTANHAVVSYQGAATVTAHLTGAPAGSPITLTETESGVTKTITTRLTNASGVISFTGRVDSRVTVTASYAGDYTHTPSTAQVVLNAHAGVTATMSHNYYKRLNGRFLFHANKHCTQTGTVGCAVFEATLRPAVHGRHFTVQVQALVRGSWHAAMNLNEKQTALTMGTRFYVPGGGTSLPMRAQVVFSGDSLNASASTAWVYWQITK